MNPYESIKTYMATNLITFTPDTDIREAMGILFKSGVSGAPVLNNEGKLIGIISEKDCMKVIVNRTYYNEPAATSKVGDYMSHEVKTIDANLSVTEAAYEFLHCNYRRFPVVDNGRLVGQVSRRDILKGIMTIEDRNVEVVPSSWEARKPVEIVSKTNRYNKKK